MNKKTISLLFISSLAIATVTTVVFGYNDNAIINTLGEKDPYALSLHNQKISGESTAYTGEVSSTIKTALGSNISFKASNVIKYEEGWQTILPGGYFYNPIDESTHHNKISGICSISYTSASSSTLALHYGYTINGSNVFYSHEVDLVSGMPFTFSEDKPAYIYIKNESNSNVDIDELVIRYTCSESTYSKLNYNVLMIGNSFADDTIYYANRIAASYGINLNIVNSYIAGCTINTHYANLTNGTSPYSMRYMNNGSWVYVDKQTLPSIINSNNWDVVTFQQASAEVGRPSTYSNLANLVNGVRSLVGLAPKFYWYQTWAYDQDYYDYYDYYSYFDNDQITMFDAIIDCYENEVDPLGLFDKTIYAGTAVQNLRTSYMKDTFSRDGKHMSSVHGRYLLGLNMISNLFDIDLDLSSCNYKPSEANTSFKNVAFEAIRNAYNHPLEITSSVYTSSEMGEYDLTNYTEIDAELVGCSYWNSTDSANYNKRNSNVNGTSNLYTSTKRFTPTTLPVGSLVFIDESFGVRPEAWTSDSQQSSRPSETYQNVIEIDSSFWDGYEYRAFNIFKAGKTELKGQYDQIFDGFHVYVPNSLLGDNLPKGYNSYYQNDKTVFESNYLNIDAFERIHLDPITGFYKCDSYYELTNSYVDDTAKKFMCSRPFYTAKGDLAENTVIIADNGYQWRSDCWTSHGTYSSRPGNVSAPLTKLSSSFMEGFYRRTINVSSTSNGYVNQNYISFFNHVRLYRCINEEEMNIEHEEGVTMTVLGYATLNSMATSMYGKSNIPVLITLSGDDTSKVTVKVDGSILSTSKYSYDPTTGALSISTSGTIGSSSFTMGTISGTVDRNASTDTIKNISIDGSISAYVTNNGTMTCSAIWSDRCNYTSDSASQLVWQRRYMSGSWQYNSGSGQWTTSDTSYHMEEEHSMGLRIANNTYKKTAFLLKRDLGDGNGIQAHGVSLWIYNPNHITYDAFRIYIYTSASTIVGDHVTTSGNYFQAYSTSGIASGSWINIQTGFSANTVYNFSLYFENNNNSSTTYVNLGHICFY